MRKIILIATFSLITPLTLAIITTSALYISKNATNTTIAHHPKTEKYYLFKSVPESNEKIMGASTISHDARSALLKKFLTKYASPLAPLSDYIVLQADKYNIDYRLIPAIAMQESTGCKFIPENSYNCWGYGIYGDKVIRFESYQHGIETVSRGLRKNYYDQGLDTPYEIMHKYTPPSVKIGGPWARGVEYFFNEIENPTDK